MPKTGIPNPARTVETHVVSEAALKGDEKRRLTGRAIQDLTNLNIECNGAHPAHEAKALKFAAESLMSAFPQYRGHWAEYKIGRIKRNIVTKSGFVFQNGDFVLYKPNACIITISEYFTVWSFRTMCDVSVHFSALERL